MRLGPGGRLLGSSPDEKDASGKQRGLSPLFAFDDRGSDSDQAQYGEEWHMTYRAFVTGVCGLMLATLIGSQVGCTMQEPAAARPAAASLEFRVLAERDPVNPEAIKSSKPEYRRPVQEYLDLLKEKGPTTRPSDVFRWCKIVDPEPQSYSAMLGASSACGAGPRTCWHTIRRTWGCSSQLRDGRFGRSGPGETQRAGRQSISR